MAKQSLTQLIGQRVREVRQSKDMTTTVLAKKVGVSQAQISRLETAQQGFRSETLSRIASALGVPPYHLVVDAKTLAKLG